MGVFNPKVEFLEKKSMSKTRAQKAESIDELVAAFKEGKAAFFVDYQGMSVDKVTALP